MKAFARNPRRRIGPATTFLIRAFAPVCPTNLRCWSSKPAKCERGRKGEAISLVFDLPDQDAFTRALELERSAGALRLIRVGRTVVAELKAEVVARHRTLLVDALLVTAPVGGEQ